MYLHFIIVPTLLLLCTLHDHGSVHKQDHKLRDYFILTRKRNSYYLKTTPSLPTRHIQNPSKQRGIKEVTEDSDSVTPVGISLCVLEFSNFF